MKSYPLLKIFLAINILFCISCKKKEVVTSTGTIQLAQVKAGSVVLKIGETSKDIDLDSSFIIYFNNALDPSSVNESILLKKVDNTGISCNLVIFNSNRTIRLTPQKPLEQSTNYKLQITSGLKGANGETFPGVEFLFITIAGKLRIETITINQQDFQLPIIPQNINWKNVNIEITFSDSLDPSNLNPYFTLSSGMPLAISLSEHNNKVTVSNTQNLIDYSRCFFTISKNLTSKNGFPFDGFTNYFYTSLDSTYKFPPLSDDELLTLVQRQTLTYFVDFAHPACGMARERNTSGDVVAIGGSGFGVMGLVVGISRGFITRDQGLTQFGKILTFLESCDRFHGAWPHWANGNTGHVVPFGPKDDGGDIVETSYMVMGLFTLRQYLDSTNSAEKTMIQRINTLINGVEYDWYTQGQNVLYWNWSPDWGFAVNTKVEGYNETLITYIIAAASSTHSISANAYHQGYAHNGGIKNGNTYYGYVLPLGEPYGGPLFFTQYTYLGVDPRNLNDEYANYWQQNVNQSLINYSYCVANPHKWIGYSSSSWGLTASDNPWGYSAHSPTHDLGVISPTAAVSALPYAPVQSLNAIRHFYFILGNRLWGTYGFYDAFDVTEGWWALSYIAIDEGPIIGMIENYRTQLLWNLFMSCPEIQQGLTKLGFTYK